MWRIPLRSLLAVTVSWVLPNAAEGQVCALGQGGAQYKRTLDQNAGQNVVVLIQSVGAAFSDVCAPKCPAVTVFANSTAPNALTFTAAGQTRIVYAPSFFRLLSERYGEGAPVGIAAHQYGHIIDAVSLGSWMNTDWTPELRADAWAGCALAKLKVSGLRLRQGLTAMARYPSTAHIIWASRLPALRTGYNRCGGQVSEFDTAAANLTHK